MAVSTASVTSGSVAGRRDRAGRAGRLLGASGDCRRRPGDERPLGLERQQALGLLEGDPADRLELVVMGAEIATGLVHQVVVDGLVDPRAALDEPVLDR